MRREVERKICATSLSKAGRTLRRGPAESLDDGSQGCPFPQQVVACVNREWSKRVSAIFTLNWGALLESVAPRIELYREGLQRVHEDDEILDGEPIFKGTRLAVRYIGGMRIKGEPIEDIMRDYPDLAPEDIAFARLYTAAHPFVGRPRPNVAQT